MMGKELRSHWLFSIVTSLKGEYGGPEGGASTVSTNDTWAGLSTTDPKPHQLPQQHTC